MVQSIPCHLFGTPDEVIYTYRSRLKSRAIAKDSFEDDIKKIATY
jgi:hypothetical protein